MIRVTIGALLFGFVVGACGTADEGDDDGASEGPGSCEHGTYSACACSDGSTGTQLCAHDTSGFEECICGGNDDASGPDTTPGTDGDSSSAGSGVDPSTTEDSGPDETTDGSTTNSSVTSGPGETGAVGSPPSAMINHPGPEDRQAGVPIPFIGVADDPEDGALLGMSMIWTDDLEGMIGEGEMFDAPLDTLGDHTVTLTATDADGNIAEDSITFAVVP
jgi:hypothetical protein